MRRLIANETDLLKYFTNLTNTQPPSTRRAKPRNTLGICEENTWHLRELTTLHQSLLLRVPLCSTLCWKYALRCTESKQHAVIKQYSVILFYPVNQIRPPDQRTWWSRDGTALEACRIAKLNSLILAWVFSA